MIITQRRLPALRFYRGACLTYRPAGRPADGRPLGRPLGRPNIKTIITQRGLPAYDSTGARALPTGRPVGRPTAGRQAGLTQFLRLDLIQR